LQYAVPHALYTLSLHDALPIWSASSRGYNKTSMFMKIKDDLAAAQERDPAATSKLEVILTYAGFHAMLAYRIAHRFHTWGVPIIDRKSTRLNSSHVSISYAVFC